MNGRSRYLQIPTILYAAACLADDWLNDLQMNGNSLLMVYKITILQNKFIYAFTKESLNN
jgi:hypothetical protein